MHLSPLNFRGLIDTMRLVVSSEPTKTTKRRRAIECWRCPECSDVHEWEDEAEECCAEEEAKETPKAKACPVCAAKCETFRDAADCCLWKDIDAYSRWRIADAVEAGSTWPEQLGVLHNVRAKAALPPQEQR